MNLLIKDFDEPLLLFQRIFQIWRRKLFLSGKTLDNHFKNEENKTVYNRFTIVGFSSRNNDI